jgi:hypothetical protein
MLFLRKVGSFMFWSSGINMKKSKLIIAIFLIISRILLSILSILFLTTLVLNFLHRTIRTK